MFYHGTVVAYNPATERHTVQYDDGDREDLVSSTRNSSSNPRFEALPLYLRGKHGRWCLGGLGCGAASSADR